MLFRSLIISLTALVLFLGLSCVRGCARCSRFCFGFWRNHQSYRVHPKSTASTHQCHTRRDTGRVVPVTHNETRGCSTTAKEVKAGINKRLYITNPTNLTPYYPIPTAPDWGSYKAHVDYLNGLGNNKLHRHLR